jgi:hypothetical protein
MGNGWVGGTREFRPGSPSLLVGRLIGLVEFSLAAAGFAIDLPLVPVPLVLGCIDGVG